MSPLGLLSAPAAGYIRNLFSHKQPLLFLGAESHCKKRKQLRDVKQLSYLITLHYTVLFGMVPVIHIKDRLMLRLVVSQ